MEEDKENQAVRRQKRRTVRKQVSELGKEDFVAVDLYFKVRPPLRNDV